MKTIVWKNISTSEKETALARPVSAARADLGSGVAAILDQVKRQRDGALRELTSRFDGVSLANIQVTAEEIESGRRKVAPEVRRAMGIAAANIEKFHKLQIPESSVVETMPGVVCERQFRAIGRVGLYVPGGTASLPSTVLMLGIPARIAGCPVRVLCTPPRKDGSVDPYVLEAASLCGIHQIFKVGGAQAIGAMSFGTESVPKVDKIFGPGNAWVTEAKEQVSRQFPLTAIDMPAGPSEVLVIADKKANAELVAADLLSQAEHGTDSQVVLVTDSPTLATEVKAAIERQLSDLPRAEIARGALEQSVVVLVDSVREAIEVSNEYAPEHLILQVEEARQYKGRIQNAGSVFLGPWTAESAGDYASGTNHVLPTYGHARAVSGLSVDSFLKQVTFQEISPEGLRQIGPTIEQLATVEELHAHRRAITLRLAVLQKGER